MIERFVTVERGEDGVALIRLDRPKANAISPEVLQQLADVATDLRDDPPGAVVVWGGERIFAAGADIGRFGGPAEARIIGGLFRDALDTLASIPRIVIAAVNGYALGGGCELALACDLRIAAEDATFGQPEILLGIVPGGGATQRLPRLIGPSRAKDLIVTGRMVKAPEALELGLVNLVVPAHEVLVTARELAARLAAGALVAQAMVKALVDESLDLPLVTGLSREQDLFADSFATDDAKIGIQSFLEQGPGKAKFTGK